MYTSVNHSNISVKSIDQNGVFEGYASVFNVTDEQNDLIKFGAFRKSILRPNRIKLLWQHNTSEPIGVIEYLKEDSYGLYMKAKLLLDVPKAKEAYYLIKSGAISGLSIGYRIEDFNYDACGVRSIKRLTLLEVSIVTFPANKEANITEVKSIDGLEVVSKALDVTIEKFRGFII
jgi:HK97 family phage prohead protease